MKLLGTEAVSRIYRFLRPPTLALQYFHVQADSSKSWVKPYFLEPGKLMQLLAAEFDEGLNFSRRDPRKVGWLWDSTLISRLSFQIVEP